MNYFSEFPTLNYPILVNGSPVYYNVTDILVRYEIISTILQDPFGTYEYLVKDGDRPDTIADMYYDDPSLAWIVMLSNTISDFQYDFPMPIQILENYIMNKYSITYAQMFSTIHHYEDADGDIIDLTTYMLNPSACTVVYVYDYEYGINENKRRIKLISKKYTQQLISELQNSLSVIIQNRANSITGVLGNI